MGMERFRDQGQSGISISKRPRICSLYSGRYEHPRGQICEHKKAMFLDDP